MKSKVRQGRAYRHISKVQKIKCIACDMVLEYGGTYPQNAVCLTHMDLAVCPDCKLAHQIMWVHGKAIRYPSTDPEWVFSAGMRDVSWL